MSSAFFACLHQTTLNIDTEPSVFMQQRDLQIPHKMHAHKRQLKITQADDISL